VRERTAFRVPRPKTCISFSARPTATPSFPLCSPASKNSSSSGFPKRISPRRSKKNFPTAKTSPTSTAISGGNLGKAEELAGEGSLTELSAKAAQIALNLTASTAVEFARGLVSEKVEGNKFLPLLRLAFRDMLMLRLNRKDLLLFGGERAVLEKAAKRYDERALVFSQEAIGQAERNLKFNANPAMTYETLFIRILEGR